MNEHVANMAPSTTLTPPQWKHCSIHPDTATRFKLCGYASAIVWLPGDLRALGVKVKSGKVYGLTKERALEIGQQIEDAMLRAESGQPLKSISAEPAEPASPAKLAPAKAKPAPPPQPGQTTLL